MKPRYRPGKAGTGGKAARAAVAKAKLPTVANAIINDIYFCVFIILSS